MSLEGVKSVDFCAKTETFQKLPLIQKRFEKLDEYTSIETTQKNIRISKSGMRKAKVKCKINVI